MDDKAERYAQQMLGVLERIAVVLERFDNAMNPTLGGVTDLENYTGLRFIGEEFPAVDLPPHGP